MSNKKNGKTAVLVIHGMGSQFPMETANDFVNNIFHDEKVYSVPERITGFFDQRKLVAPLIDGKYDFYEYYWAHLISEPDTWSTINWLFSLLFWKNPSERMRPVRWYLRLGILAILVAISIGVYLYYDKLFLNLFYYDSAIQLLIIGLPFLFIIAVKYLLRKLVFSFGDVIRYTVPHPKNINNRQKISESAVNFLLGINSLDYDRIVVIGHSLGSIVAYEMLINAFNIFNSNSENHVSLSDEDVRKINDCKNANEVRNKMGEPSKWKVTDFVTCGSPLCHAEMLLVKDHEMFIDKIEKGEYPQCPPHNKENIFYEKNNKYYIKHSSVFAFINWNNLYFNNDLIGGKLRKIFGEGIVDHKLKPKTSGIFTSHSNYWNRERESESYSIIRNIIENK